MNKKVMIGIIVWIFVLCVGIIAENILNKDTIEKTYLNKIKKEQDVVSMGELADYYYEKGAYKKAEDIIYCR